MEGWGGGGLCARARRTCVSGRVNDVITLIKADALGPRVQGEFVAGAENRARYRQAAHRRYERSARVTVVNLLTTKST